MKIIFRSLWMLLAATLFGAAANAADHTVVIKFSHVTAPETPKGWAALRFKEIAEKRTAGKVRIEVYPNGTLFKDKDEFDALRAGSVQMLAPSLVKLSAGPIDVTEFQLFNLPYIFPSVDLLRRITSGPIGAAIFAKLEPQGIIGLAYWDNGFMSMSANRPLRKPLDMSGLKMRVSSSAGEPMMRKLGALPQVMPLSDVYQAMRAGRIDGTENVPSNLYTQNLHEVQKYITVSNHSYLGYAVIANKKFWDGLPADIRVQLKLALLDATRYANLYAERENNEALAKIRASGNTEIYTLSIDEREAWRRALMPVHEALQARVGKELIQAVYKEGAALGYKF